MLRFKKKAIPGVSLDVSALGGFGILSRERHCVPAVMKNN